MGLKKIDPEAILTERDVEKLTELRRTMESTMEKWHEPDFFENETLNLFIAELITTFDYIAIDKHIADYVTTVGNKFGVEVPVIWKNRH